METSLIEHLDKSRYNLQKWFTIGFGLWFASIILNNFMEFHILNVSAAVLAILGTPIYAISQIKLLKLKRKLEADNKMKEALNNELYVLNTYKSLSVSGLVCMGITGLFIIITHFIQISALLVTELILYSGIMAALISSLYYNRS